MCQVADFLYAHARYGEAARIYTTIMNLFEQGLWEMTDYDKIVSDSVGAIVYRLPSSCDLDSLQVGSLFL